MKTKATLLILALTITFAFSCSQKEEHFPVDIIEGVRHVHNNAPQWGDEPKVALEFVKKIGALEATEENFIMYNISDVDCDSQGNIYILDSGNYRIQKFNADGEYMATFGRKGEGPGELNRRPINMTFGPDEELFVGVSYNFIVFDKSGKELRRYRQETNIEPSQCWLLPGGRMIMGGRFGMV